MIVVPAGLRRFVTPTGAQSRPDFVPPRSKMPPLGESCEMCGAALVDEHQHVVNLDSRRLLCTCRPCYLLFTREGAGRGNYSAVPDRYLFDPDVVLSDALTCQEWCHQVGVSSTSTSRSRANASTRSGHS